MSERFFFTLNELRTKLYAAYPEMKQIAWIDDALHELWEKGTPSPHSWDYRMILPSEWRMFARSVGERIGREISAKPSG